MSSHTPGPWQWRYANNGETVDIADGQELIDDSMGAFFLEGGTRGDGVEVLSCDCVTVADGRLIRAAPDLLEACQYGLMGHSANILLWNASGCLKEIGERDGNQTLLSYAAGLRDKAEMEWKAVMKARGES